MVLHVALGALMLVADAAPPVEPSAPQAPCRILTVEGRTGAEHFLSCTQKSIRLTPDRDYYLVWNSDYRQLLVRGRGAKDDQAVIVSDGDTVQPLVEDLTKSIIAVAGEAEPERWVVAFRLGELSQFAASGRLEVTAIEGMVPADKAPLTASLPMQIAGPDSIVPQARAAESGSTEEGPAYVTLIR